MVQTENLYDVVVIGGGPAGLTAALYLARARYRVVVVEKDHFGGQITITSEVVNFPGVERTSGAALTESMRKQAESFGAEFLLAEVTGLDLTGDVKTVRTSRCDLKCFGVLLATGTKELPAFGGLGGARLYPRVLPTHEALGACGAAGIPGPNIIAMQGPFTQALNEALLHQYGARWFVTKDGGAPGGFAEKAAAARAAGAQLVVIRRPEVKVDGVSYEQALEACRKAVQRCRIDPGSP